MPDGDQRARQLVEQLGSDDHEESWLAFRNLNEMGDEAVLAVLDGLSHANWRVRRGCALYVDRHPVPELLDRIRLTLHDPKARVRMLAVHSLACEHCKPGGNPADPIPALINALKNDKAIRVRRMAAAGLTQYADETRVARALRRALESEVDRRLRKVLHWGLQRHQKLTGAGT